MSAIDQRIADRLSRRIERMWDKYEATGDSGYLDAVMDAERTLRRVRGDTP